MKKAVITVDVELDRREGGTEGMEKLDKMLKHEKNFTLFVTPNTVKKVPEMVSRWSDDHEIGLHIHPIQIGFQDDLFDSHCIKEQRTMFQRALEVIDDHISEEKMRSFRPGKWRFHENIYKLMEEFDMSHSSSKYPKPYFDNRPEKVEEIIEFDPTIWSPSFLARVGKEKEKSAKGFKNQAGIDLPIHSLKKLGVVFNAALCNHVDYPLLYVASTRLSKLEYQMFTFHSFNLLEEKIENRVEDFIRYIKKKREIVQLSKIRLD